MRIQRWNLVFLIGFIVYVCIRGVFKQRTKNNENVISRADVVEKTLIAIVIPGGLLLPIGAALGPFVVIAQSRRPIVSLAFQVSFNSDNAGAIVVGAIPTSLFFDGWSARATGGVTARFGNGVQIAVGAERSGIGCNFGLWTYRARASIPFGAQ